MFKKLQYFMEGENEGGKGGEASWRDSLPDALKADPSLASFKDVASLADSFVKTKALVGSSIRIPGPDASVEDRKGFLERLQKSSPDLVYLPEKADEAVMASVWKKLGLPEKAEEYAVDEETGKAVNLQALRDLGGKVKLTKAQFVELAKAEAAVAKAAKEAFTAAHEALDKEWGAAAKERIAAAASVAEKLGLDAGVVKAITERSVPAEQLKLLFAVAQAVGGNPREKDRHEGSKGGAALTPDEATAQINEMLNNKAHAYWNRGDPAHGAAMRRMLELQGYADPSAVKEPPRGSQTTAG